MNLSFQAPRVPAQEKINHRQNLDAQGPKSRLSHKNLLLKALNGEKHSSHSFDGALNQTMLQEQEIVPMLATTTHENVIDGNL